MAARLVLTHDPSRVIELRGATLTIGRAPDCDFQVNDERVSGRHCRLTLREDMWMIEDLRSTNRTFVNGAPVTEHVRRLHHNDIVRLGGADAVLLEVRFVSDRAAEFQSRPPELVRAVESEASARQKVAELQAELRERNAEIVRMAEQAKRWQSERAAMHSERADRQTAAVSAERNSSTLAADLEELRADLAHERADLAASRAATQRAERRIAELESQLAAAERRRNADLNDSALKIKDLESRLRMALSDLAVARAAGKA